jgi:hypothetical protein
MLKRCGGVESKQTIQIVKENIKTNEIMKIASIFNLQLQVKNEAKTCF